MDRTEVVNKALDFRRNVLKLDDFEPIENSYQLAEKAGYFIVALPLSKEFAMKEERGFYLKIGSSNFIFINTSCYLSTQNFTVWHEIYHSLFPIDISNSTKNEVDQDENNAEIFASSILLPPKAMEMNLSECIKSDKLFNNQILDLATKYNLHYKAVITHIFKLYPQFKDRGYLYAKENEGVMKLDFNSKKKYDELSQTNQKYITKSIFDAIEKNYKDKLLDNEELKK